MNEQETVVALETLAYVNERAVTVFDAAMQHIRDPELLDEVRRYRDEHQRNSQELRSLREGMTGGRQRPPEGFEQLQREQTRLATEAHREEEALEALLLVEEVASAHYGFASAMQMPDPVRRTMESHLRNERQHVQALSERVGPLGVEIAGGGVTQDRLFVDDKNPDDFEPGDEGLSGRREPH